jgi:hypothetical protein
VLKRARQWIVEQVPFLTVAGLLAAAFLYLIVEPAHWRRGSGALGVAILLAAALRAVLSTQRAGLLAVRARWLDVLAYLAMGGVILGVDIRLHG